MIKIILSDYSYMKHKRFTLTKCGRKQLSDKKKCILMYRVNQIFHYTIKCVKIQMFRFSHICHKVKILFRLNGACRILVLFTIVYSNFGSISKTTAEE
jgi:hypothetical protein